MAALDLISSPLKGITLVEAHAGTGKTFSIAALYLRMVLGINSPVEDTTGTPKALRPRDLLVVTFSNDAAAELRSRITTRIHEASRAFRIDETDDPVLRSLMDAADELAVAEGFSNAREQAVARLEAAAMSMDEAAIYTIHGFAQRVITDFAFECSVPFDFEVLADRFAVAEEAASDFWRNRVLHLPGDVQTEAIAALGDTQQIAARYRPPQAHTIVRWGAMCNEDDLRAQLDKNARAMRELKEALESIGSKAIDDEIVAADLNARSYPAGKLAPKVDALIKGLGIGYKLTQDQMKTIDKLSPEGIERGRKKSTPAHLSFSFDQAIAKFIEAYEEIDWQPFLDFIQDEANTHVYHFIERHKRDRGVFDFDDLLNLVNKALSGPMAEKLKDRLNKKFPLAMVDEFQDTDPVQYSVFSTLYLNRENVSMLMIGDPKQAIYGFRGGDVFTYMVARDDATRVYNLDTNYRSHPRAVLASNSLFEGVDLSLGTSAGFASEGINYTPVKPKSKDITGGLMDGASQIAGLTLVIDDETIKGKGKATTEFASQAAEAIATMLSRSGNNGFTIDGQPVAPRDIAILVNTHWQGDEMQTALRERGVMSVNQSKQSVYETQTARDILVLLESILEKGSERKVKTAIASEIMALSTRQMDAVMNRDAEWDRVLEYFGDIHEVWSRFGLAPALQRLWQQFKLSRRYCDHPNAERLITNWRHIVELLQDAERRLDSRTDLVEYLRQRISNPERTQEEEIRLESEENLVQIVTTHKSKGLEYPIVFLPFASIPFEPRDVIYHEVDQSGEMVKVIDHDRSDEGHVTRAIVEAAAESVRLMYVASTRAKFATFMFAQPVAVQTVDLMDGSTKREVASERSPIGYLLGVEAAEDYLPRVKSLVDSEGITIASAAPPQKQASTFYTADFGADSEFLKSSTFDGHIDWSWRVSSFSGITSESHEVSSEQMEMLSEGKEDTVGLTPVDPDSFVQTFPKGAKPGLCLHDILEDLNFDPHLNPLDMRVADNLSRYGIDGRLAPQVIEWMEAVMAQPLAGGFKLNNLTSEDAIAEMKFDLTVGEISAAKLNEILSDHPLHGQNGDLDFSTFRGGMTGFIDLTVFKGGKAWVIDYKSNWLPDYSEDAMNEAIGHHRYYVQYLLYTVALHRYLQKIVPGYDYDQHFGGVQYLFLRGMNGTEGSGIHSYRPSKQQVERLDKLLQPGTLSEVA